jgi:hypothetical protein
VNLLRTAGYTATAPLWQVGDDHIVVGLRWTPAGAAPTSRRASS